MMSEQLNFVPLGDGCFHLAGDPPFKTVFVVSQIAFRWITHDQTKGAVRIDLPDRTIFYDRVATGPHGEWICTLRGGSPVGAAVSEESTSSGQQAWDWKAIRSSLFAMDPGVNMMPGQWRECSPDWRANGSIGSTEYWSHPNGQITKVKCGPVSYEAIDGAE